MPIASSFLFLYAAGAAVIFEVSPSNELVSTSPSIPNPKPAFRVVVSGITTIHSSTNAFFYIEDINGAIGGGEYLLEGFSLQDFTFPTRLELFNHSTGVLGVVSSMSFDVVEQTLQLSVFTSSGGFMAQEGDLVEFSGDSFFSLPEEGPFLEPVPFPGVFSHGTYLNGSDGIFSSGSIIINVVPEPYAASFMVVGFALFFQMRPKRRRTIVEQGGAHQPPTAASRLDREV